MALFFTFSNNFWLITAARSPQNTCVPKDFIQFSLCIFTICLAHTKKKFLVVGNSRIYRKIKKLKFAESHPHPLTFSDWS